MNDLLTRLPEYEPRPDLWNRIEADLDTDERLVQVINELPDFEPENDLWDRIDAALDQPNPTLQEPRLLLHPATESARQVPFGRQTGQVHIAPRWRAWLATGVSAACLVLLGTWLFRYMTALPTERIEYAVEQAEPVPTDVALPEQSTADQRAEEFIARQCEESALACQKPEVRELRAQLGELTSEQQRLAAERRTFGDDPALVMAQVKLENQRAEVTKELITLLRS
ncbi:hypothetical protein [uncultured Fibrella sp.]|uniref:hypothetical protein n=1 Tax=uncultured Fibrella sp. TaxID=1284596 RepID=UPI0035CB1257